MKRNRFVFLFLLAAVLFAVSGCKKKNADTPYYEFSGRLAVEETIPYYMNRGDALNLTPGGLKHADSDPKKTAEITYAVFITPMMSYRDTLKSPTFSTTIPDTLTTLKVSVYGSAPEYSTASLDMDIVVVDKDRSLTNLSFDPNGSTFVDDREGRQRVYHTTRIGGLEWMSENLAYSGVGKSYRSTKEGYGAMTDIYGGYYDWYEAQTACPDGWRLPTDEDWAAMASALSDTPCEPLKSFLGIAGKLMGDGYLNREKLWEYFPGMNLSPEASYLNLLPTGYGMISGETCLYETSSMYSVYWTASEYDEKQAYCRSIYNSKTDVSVSHVHKDSFLAPVRCVRD